MKSNAVKWFIRDAKMHGFKYAIGMLRSRCPRYEEDSRDCGWLELPKEKMVATLAELTNSEEKKKLDSLEAEEAAERLGYVLTNMGAMPEEDYLDIVAYQHGYDSYDEIRKEIAEELKEAEKIDREMREQFEMELKEGII